MESNARKFKKIAKSVDLERIGILANKIMDAMGNHSFDDGLTAMHELIARSASICNDGWDDDEPFFQAIFYHLGGKKKLLVTTTVKEIIDN